MYCGNCGFPLSDDAIFCTRCGTRLRPSAPVQPVNEPIAPVEQAPVAEQTAAVEQAPVNEQPEPVLKQTNANEQPFAPEQQTMTAEQTEQPAAPEKQPEKEFFGKGAFAFCLVVIAILAIACGIFAGLYFGGAGKPAAGAVARDNIIRDYFDDNYEGGFIEW
ncbi:MAG: zinc-ribbon domain-containing protein [Ruminiclostridium sp.]